MQKTKANRKAMPTSKEILENLMILAYLECMLTISTMFMIIISNNNILNKIKEGSHDQWIYSYAFL